MWLAYFISPVKEKESYAANACFFPISLPGQGFWGYNYGMSGKLSLYKSYQNFLSAVKAALTAGLLVAQKVLEYEHLRTYWQIGKEISTKRYPLL